jgi:hypothetical protein
MPPSELLRFVDDYKLLGKSRTALAAPPLAS